MKRAWTYLFLLILPFIFLVYLQGNFAFPVRGDYSDLVISHLPNAEFLRQSLMKGEIPLWSPRIFAGYPFAADPLSGLHYPFGWLALLFPLPFGFNLVTAIHLAFGGLGMFFFLKGEGISQWPALAASLVFQAMPKLMAHFAAGHLTLVFAVCLTPWALWAEQKRHESTLLNGWRVAPGIVLALITLADPRWTPYAAILWLGYSIRSFIIRRKSTPGEKFLSLAGGVLSQGIVVLVLSALLWLPLLEYVPLTTRSIMNTGEKAALSLPPANLLGLFIPSLGGYAEWVLYPGAIAWLLFVFILAVPGVRRQAWFWLALLGLSLLAAFGDSVPGYQLLTRLPGFSLLRVPSRSLFLCGFSFSVLSAYALEYLVQNRVEQKPEPVFFMVPFVAFPLFIAAGMGFYLGGYYLPFLWAGIASLIGLFIILAFEKRWLPGEKLLMVLIPIYFIELAAVDVQFMVLKNPKDVLHNDIELVRAISTSKNEPYRIYSPSFSLPQYISGDNGLDILDGIDPLQITAFDDLFEKASGIPINGYTVTLPPFPSGEPASDNQGYVPDSKLLGVMNVKYVVSAFPVDAAGLQWIQKVNGDEIYLNLNYRNRALVEHEDGTILNAEIASYQANTVVINATGPGRLVLADVLYPGWNASVDGMETPIEPYSGILRSVVIGSGNHQVVFYFQPFSVYFGWAIAMLGWIMLIAISVKNKKNKGSRNE
ncbi:MAG TPA: hypothetical protein VN452_00715 [Longilinea sp.]|nr:hypothetical protein [Longilinea sp.]